MHDSELHSVQLSLDSAATVTLTLVAEDPQADQAFRAWADLDLDGMADVEFRGLYTGGAYTLQAFALAGMQTGCTGATRSTSRTRAVRTPRRRASAMPRASSRLASTTPAAPPSATSCPTPPRLARPVRASPARTQASRSASRPAHGSSRSVALSRRRSTPTSTLSARRTRIGSKCRPAPTRASPAPTSRAWTSVRSAARRRSGGRIFELFQVGLGLKLRMTRIIAVDAPRARVIISEERSYAGEECVPGDGWTTAVDLELPVGVGGVVAIYLRTPAGATRPAGAMRRPPRRWPASMSCRISRASRRAAQAATAA